MIFHLTHKGTPRLLNMRSVSGSTPLPYISQASRVEVTSRDFPIVPHEMDLSTEAEHGIILHMSATSSLIADCSLKEGTFQTEVKLRLSLICWYWPRYLTFQSSVYIHDYTRYWANDTIGSVSALVFLFIRKSISELRMIHLFVFDMSNNSNSTVKKYLSFKCLEELVMWCESLGFSCTVNVISLTLALLLPFPWSDSPCD